MSKVKLNHVFRDVNGIDYNLNNIYAVGYHVNDDDNSYFLIIKKYKTQRRAEQALPKLKASNGLFKNKFKLKIFEVDYIIRGKVVQIRYNSLNVYHNINA